VGILPYQLPSPFLCIFPLVPLLGIQNESTSDALAL
jgi:hypothetical protein